MFKFANMIRALFTKKAKAAPSVRPPWKGFLPGMWIPQTDSVSLFETEQLAMNEIINSPEYREYFE